MTDINVILKKLEPMKEVPPRRFGKTMHTWKPILDYAIGKGYFRVSEDDVSIQSALNGLNKEAKLQGVKVALNTRKINGKIWLYIIVKK